MGPSTSWLQHKLLLIPFKGPPVPRKSGPPAHVCWASSKFSFWIFCPAFLTNVAGHAVQHTTATHGASRQCREEEGELSFVSRSFFPHF